MGMKTEFYEAVEWVRKSLSFNHVRTVSVFETTIRELAGLLAAFDLSGEKVLLEKADDLGSRLIHAFDGGIGIPRSSSYHLHPHLLCVSVSVTDCFSSFL
jgi:hypothetical protein